MAAFLGSMGSALGGMAGAAGTAATAAPSAIGSAFGLSPDMVKMLGQSGDKAKAAIPQPGQAPQVQGATPNPVDLGQILDMLQKRSNLGT